jgi:hypothetical protein
VAFSVEQRRYWATRRGNPLWLWPEIEPAAWSVALAQFEQSARAVLTGVAVPPLDGTATAFRLAGYTSGMAPMLGYWSETGLLPESPLNRLFGQQLEANRRRMAHLLDWAKRVAGLMTRAGLDVLVLKGAHTSAYFPDPACRPMSDIDLLVPARQRALADSVLGAAGFECVTNGQLESCWRVKGAPCEPVTMTSLEAADPWTVDLHYSLDVEGPPGARPARLSRFEPFSGMRPWDPLPSAGCLGQPLLLLHLAAHAGSGFQNLTMVRLLELILVIREDCNRGALDWDDFLALGSATGALSFAFPALDLARSLSPADMPDEVVARCRREAPARIRRLTSALTPATAHGIHRRSIREHYAWTQGLPGWLRRLAADLLPDRRSLRRTAAIHRSRASALLSYSAAGRRWP